MLCTNCHSPNTVKHGTKKKKLQRYRCKDCGKTFSSSTIGRLCGCWCHLLRTSLKEVGIAIRWVSLGADIYQVALKIKRSPKTIWKWVKRVKERSCTHCNAIWGVNTEGAAQCDILGLT
jgi:transposase-like protein